MFIKTTLGVGLTVLCLAINAQSSFTKLGKQGYENVVVRISDDVPSTNCVQIIDRIQVMMQDASNAMCKALDNRAYLGNVTIMVPLHWTADGNCVVDSSITWPRIHKADFIVGQDHPVYGSRPFSLQYGGCGVSSLAVHLPLNFLNEVSAKGVAIAHEWFHYRYGAYDEVGINGDSLYPNGYQITQTVASILPTSCTNVPLKGEWLGNEWQNSYDNNNVTSSIMFSTELPNINRLCTKDDHLKAPPTKQNWLCGGRSVSEIVYSHYDFINHTQPTTCNQTRFSVATVTHRGYHIVLDVSSGMAVNNLMEDAKFAVSHFIWFLPDGLTVSVDTFSDSYSQVQTPIVLNMTNKNLLLAHLDDIQVTSGSTAALGLALDNAVRMSRHQGMEIIIVTSAQQVPSNFSVYVEEFRRNLIAPHILALSVQTSKLFSALAWDGWLYSIPTWTKPSMVPGTKNWNPQTWMIDIMQSVYSRTRSYRAKIEERTVLLSEWTNGTFQLDSPATNLMFSFYPLGDGFLMTFTTGSLVSPLNEECTILHINENLYPADCEITTFENGTWSYFIKVKGSSTVRMDVWFEANSISPVKVESWTNSFQNQPINWANERVIVYALVTEQHRAVSGLSPVVHLIGDNATDAIISVTLDENNPSDVTKGDGIYSAQLINLPRYSTHFSYVLEIISGTGTVDNGIFNGHPSAGSSIPFSQPTPRSTSFNRYVYGGSFQLTQPYDGRDVLPPGRITSLAILNFNSNNATVELKWTGPKDDYDASSSYYIKWFTITGEEDGTPGVETSYFNGTIQPLPGSLDKMTYTVDVPKSNKSQNVYYRVYGIDTVGNKGQASNIATVYVPATIFPVDPEDVTQLPPALFWFLIGLACVCLLLLVAIAIAFVRRLLDARKRKAMAADWVQIGETTLDLRPPNGKEATRKSEPEVPDFHANSTPSPRRLSDDFSTRWSDNSYSAGSDIYQQPERIFTTARIETPAYSGVHERPPIRPGLPTYSFGDNRASNASPPMSVTPSPKKIPPPPPQRKFFPYPPDKSNSENRTKKTLRFGDNDETPLASSPSYLASQLTKDNLSYRGDGQMPKSYSEQTLTSASNSSLSKFGIILGADSEASLV